MSGANDIDNAVAAQTELNRRNGSANGVGTIIPREELQKLLKQQTLLPPSQQQSKILHSSKQELTSSAKANLAETSADKYAAAHASGPQSSN